MDRKYPEEFHKFREVYRENENKRALIIILLLIIGILVTSYLSLQLKTKWKYPSVKQEFNINTGITSFDKNCITPEDLYVYIVTFQNLVRSSINFENKCENTSLALITRTTNKITDFSYDVDNNSKIIRTELNSNYVLIWINAIGKEELSTRHSVDITSKINDTFSNRYRVVPMSGNLKEVGFSYDENKYICDESCFLVFSKASSYTIGKSGSIRYKEFEVFDNSLVLGFFPANTIKSFLEIISMSITAGLILALVDFLIQKHLNKRKR